MSFDMKDTKYFKVGISGSAKTGHQAFRPGKTQTVYAATEAS